MAKYRIAWLPGDGIGGEVLEAAEVVLDKLELDAEYVYGETDERDDLEITAVEVVNNTTGKRFPVVPLPKSRQAIIDAGGLIPCTRNRLLERAAGSAASASQLSVTNLTKTTI
jgi:hypothetical protein